jgi:hypothetical protein
MALHRLREQADVVAVRELFTTALPMKAERVSLIEARQFNDFVRNRRTMNLKCPPKSIDPNQQTNLMHTALQRCRIALQEKVGWKLPASGGGKTKTLELSPPAASMLTCFYPAFLIRNSAQEHSNFLHTLTDTRWELPEYSEYERAVCHQHNGEIAVMAPFWAEFFDVLQRRDIQGETLTHPPTHKPTHTSV